MDIPQNRLNQFTLMKFEAVSTVYVVSREGRNVLYIFVYISDYFLIFCFPKCTHIPDLGSGLEGTQSCGVSYSFLPMDGSGWDPISPVMEHECQGAFGLSFAHMQSTEIPFLQITFC